MAVDIGSHQKIWETDTGALISSTPVVSSNKVFVAAKNGHLYVLNAATSEKIKDVPVAGEINSSLAQADGTFYTSSIDGNLYSVN